MPAARTELCLLGRSRHGRNGRGVLGGYRARGCGFCVFLAHGGGGRDLNQYTSFVHPPESPSALQHERLSRHGVALALVKAAHAQEVGDGVVYLVQDPKSEEDHTKVLLVRRPDEESGADAERCRDDHVQVHGRVQVEVDLRQVRRLRQRALDREFKSHDGEHVRGSELHAPAVAFGGLDRKGGEGERRDEESREANVEDK
mmetsp:Transcript_19083/g.67856  ORF Transcript_19083/g.67856 Transcript_19083/m.67856 type:complete len:201 (-) Transcript_19083:1098-1700(-)